MKFSTIATVAFAAFAAAGPVNYHQGSQVIAHEHVPDDYKRSNTDELIDVVAAKLYTAFPAEIQDAAFDNVMSDVQNMISTFMTDSSKVMELAGMDIESILGQADPQQSSLDLAIEKRYFSIPPAVKKLLIDCLKAMIKNLLLAILDISKDAGVEFGQILSEIEVKAI